MTPSPESSPGASGHEPLPPLAADVPPVPGIIEPAEPPEPAAVETALEAITGGRTLSRAQADLMRSMLATLSDLAREGMAVGDLKIADAALGEMTEAFRVFRPYRAARKITMFGSARTRPEDPVYVLARDLAAHLAAAGWMVVTGAGPGIMAAGTEGAGRDRSFGVNIRLPHEQGANPFIAQDPKLVEMRYFFTRKLMLIKESHAFALLPGGFGTLDECFELLTLLQTGKAEPAPVVLVETNGGTYWKSWERYLDEEALERGYVSPEDRALYKVTNTVDEAADEILGFYRNYHSCRWVGDLLVLRLQVAPTRPQLAELNQEFGDIVKSGTIRNATAFPPERSSNDVPELPRVALRFDRIHYGRLRMLINALNAFV
ncbi:MAG TPA: TIGR00730 family Rossman fold protein [Acidimicrobiales bacterium]|nr:TIGR00730 family Rossman fold protein [Acidimicrobiales bacterium]